MYSKSFIHKLYKCSKKKTENGILHSSASSIPYSRDIQHEI